MSYSVGFVFDVSREDDYIKTKAYYLTTDDSVLHDEDEQDFKQIGDNNWQFSRLDSQGDIPHLNCRDNVFLSMDIESESEYMAVIHGLTEQ